MSDYNLMLVWVSRKAGAGSASVERGFEKLVFCSPWHSAQQLL